MGHGVGFSAALFQKSLRHVVSWVHVLNNAFAVCHSSLHNAAVRASVRQFLTKQLAHCQTIMLLEVLR